MDEDWIAAATALKLVSAAVKGVAAQAICIRASDGLVQARARRLFKGSVPTDNCEIPAAFWWARGESAIRKDWATGDFDTWVRGDTKEHWRAYGVQFRRADIEAMLPTPTPAPTNGERAPGGRRPSALWPDWVAELAAHIHHQGFPSGTGSQGQEELIKAVADGLARRGRHAPGRATVQPVVRAVLDLLRGEAPSPSAGGRGRPRTDHG